MSPSTFQPPHDYTIGSQVVRYRDLGGIVGFLAWLHRTLTAGLGDATVYMRPSRPGERGIGGMTLVIDGHNR